MPRPLSWERHWSANNVARDHAYANGRNEWHRYRPPVDINERSSYHVLDSKSDPHDLYPRYDRYNGARGEGGHVEGPPPPRPYQRFHPAWGSHHIIHPRSAPERSPSWTRGEHKNSSEGDGTRHPSPHRSSAPPRTVEEDRIAHGPRGGRGSPGHDPGKPYDPEFPRQEPSVARSGHDDHGESNERRPPPVVPPSRSDAPSGSRSDDAAAGRVLPPDAATASARSSGQRTLSPAISGSSMHPASHGPGHSEPPPRHFLRDVALGTQHARVDPSLARQPTSWTVDGGFQRRSFGHAGGGSDRRRVTPGGSMERDARDGDGVGHGPVSSSQAVARFVSDLLDRYHGRMDEMLADPEMRAEIDAVFPGIEEPEFVAMIEHFMNLQKANSSGRGGYHEARPGYRAADEEYRREREAPVYPRGHGSYYDEPEYELYPAALKRRAGAIDSPMYAGKRPRIYSGDRSDGFARAGDLASRGNSESVGLRTGSGGIAGREYRDAREIGFRDALALSSQAVHGAYRRQEFRPNGSQGHAGRDSQERNMRVQPEGGQGREMAPAGTGVFVKRVFPVEQQQQQQQQPGYCRSDGTSDAGRDLREPRQGDDDVKSTSAVAVTPEAVAPSVQPGTIVPSANDRGKQHLKGDGEGGLDGPRSSHSDAYGDRAENEEPNPRGETATGSPCSTPRREATEAGSPASGRGGGATKDRSPSPSGASDEAVGGRPGDEQSPRGASDQSQTTNKEQSNSCRGHLEEFAAVRGFGEVVKDKSGFSHLYIPEIPPVVPRRPPSKGNKRETLSDIAQRIPVDVMRPYFNYPLRTAAEAMNISVTTLKRLCRRHGVRRWPHRQISGINRAMAHLEFQQQHEAKVLGANNSKRRDPQITNQMQELLRRRHVMIEHAFKGDDGSRQSGFDSDDENMDAEGFYNDRRTTNGVGGDHASPAKHDHSEAVGYTQDDAYPPAPNPHQNHARPYVYEVGDDRPHPAVGDNHHGEDHGQRRHAADIIDATGGGRSPARPTPDGSDGGLSAAQLSKTPPSRSTPSPLSPSRAAEAPAAGQQGHMKIVRAKQEPAEQVPGRDWSSAPVRGSVPSPPSTQQPRSHSPVEALSALPPRPPRSPLTCGVSWREQGRSGAGGQVVAAVAGEACDTQQQQQQQRERSHGGVRHPRWTNGGEDDRGVDAVGAASHAESSPGRRPEMTDFTRLTTQQPEVLSRSG